MSLFKSNNSSTPAPASSAISSSGSAPQVLTIDDVKASVPTHMRSTITHNLVNNLNAISNDPIVAENIRNNFVSYSAVLKEGRFKIEEYLNAVAYVSYKIMGNSNEEAYAKTFPQRYSALVAKGATKKDISSYVAAYNKGKLVNMILEQSLVPSWVLNQDLHQRAINHLAIVMSDPDTSAKVQVEAASALLQHLGKPKEGNFQINIGETENSGMREMRDLLQQVAANQREAIQTGRMKTIDIAAQKITNKDDD